jgi:hypothetical protein
MIFQLDLFQQYSYLGGLPKRRMAGHDAIRFEHVVGIAKAGYALQIMNYIKLIAVGDLPLMRCGRFSFFLLTIILYTVLVL